MSKKFIDEYKLNGNKVLLTEKLQNSKLLVTRSKDLKDQKNVKISYSIITDIDKYHGKFTKIKNGKTIEVKNYFLGELDGEYIEYYLNGKIMRKVIYDSGNLINQDIVTKHENDSVYETYKILGGKINGNYISYYNNGNVNTEALYSNGSITKLLIFPNNKDHKPKTTIIFDQEKISSIIDSTMSFTFEMKFISGIHYEKILYDSSDKKNPNVGKLIITNDNGKYIETYNDGRTKIEMNLVDGKLHGYFIVFYQNTVPMIESFYENNILKSFIYRNIFGDILFKN